MQSYVRWAVLLGCVVGLVSVFRISSAARADVGPMPQQEFIRLESRVNQLEQRLYTIESSLRNLEQQSRLAGANARGLSQQDLTIMSAQIQALQLRLDDDECSLAKLDERTLSPAMRDARRKSTATNDPCRLNVDAPLRLPTQRR